MEAPASYNFWLWLHFVELFSLINVPHTLPGWLAVCACVSFYELFALQAGRAPYTFPFSWHSLHSSYFFFCFFALPYFFLNIFFSYIFASFCFCWDKQKPSHPHSHTPQTFCVYTRSHTHTCRACPNPFDVAFIALACLFFCSSPKPVLPERV